jgi:hypothetical protein
MPTVGALGLFALALGVYAVTRLVALEDFPIYFFGDEALEPVLASELLRRGLRGPEGGLFPLFFDAHGYHTPLITVYVHAVGVALFGPSIAVTRASAALLTLIGTAAVALILKLIFRASVWWAAPLVMAIMPTWFLHSRTAFEATAMVSFYAAFLLCYLLYRYRSPRFLYPALVLAAMTFYAYGNGQLLIGTSGVLLALSDMRHHARHWRAALVGLGLLAVLAVPYVQWRGEHPEAIGSQLRRVNSYLVQPRPAEEKLREFSRRYAYGLSPQYWFLPNEQDLVRHRMKGLNNILLVTLPLFLLGVGVCLWRIRSPAHRTVLLAALAAPVGGAISEIAALRVAAFIVPAAVFTTLGLDLALSRFRRPVLRATTALAAAVALAGTALWLLHHALSGGALWYRDYGLYGMQWGAKQIFARVREDLRRQPGDRYLITSTWANGADVFLRFFVPGEPRVRIGSVDAWIFEQRPLDEAMVFVVTHSELQAARKSGKFEPIAPEGALAYPDGSPGFHWVRLRYVPDVAARFAADREARRQLVTQEITWHGRKLTVRHSALGAGGALDLVDGNIATLVRGLDANPFVMEFQFPEPRPVRGLAADLGAMDLTLRAVVYGPATPHGVRYEITARGLAAEPHLELSFGEEPAEVERIRVEVLDLTAGDRAHVHVREITFR